MTTSVNGVISFKQVKIPLRANMYECAMKYTEFIQRTSAEECQFKCNIHLGHWNNN